MEFLPRSEDPVLQRVSNVFCGLRHSEIGKNCRRREPLM